MIPREIIKRAERIFDIHALSQTSRTRADIMIWNLMLLQSAGEKLSMILELTGPSGTESTYQWRELVVKALITVVLHSGFNRVVMEGIGNKNIILERVLVEVSFS